MPRWLVACDACGRSAWIGRRAHDAGLDAWCEACQTPCALESASGPTASCPRCGASLTTGEPRFEELLGNAQRVAAVLAAWCGDPGPLAALLPERPRFLTDLDPPALQPADPPAARAGLQALAQGHLARARDALIDATRAPGAPARLWRGLGIAAQRLGDRGQAEQAFTRAVAADPNDTAAWLDRGVLSVQRRDYAAARADFARAGNRHEARWNRAALELVVAFANAGGLPDPALVRRARAEAGEPSAYWSDPTVGRLLWSLQLEHELSSARATPGEAPALEAAARELEFATFWDRALVVHGYAALGMKGHTRAGAEALAGELLAALAAEPFARAPAGAWLALPLAEARAASREGRPGDALAAIRSVLERPDVRRYRVPCLCGRGAVGVDAHEDADREATTRESRHP